MAARKNRTSYSLGAHEDGYRYWADFNDSIFSEGESRYAYKGTYHGDGPKSGAKCVVKVFKDGYALTPSDWTADVNTSKRAQQLAEDWHRYIPTNRPPQFKLPIIAQMDKRSICFSSSSSVLKGIIRPKGYVSIEDFIDGHYQKFSSNYGWTTGAGQFAAAFSHFTWHITNGRELVCDLQGVKKDDLYDLTDPAIHSLNGRYDS
ncbi:uncharacterized protein LOC134194596 [Corticium candelabrum]|uniref:uncharacterized protein LOC134194596 n=1 Tax=Corticium candelabrum TaxID=121492 RepID=UPI002E25B7A5|nr:uncharacterized protein LOC134194596 [Corticium candelabrum]